LGQNIVSATPKPIENYSAEMSSLIMDMLEKNPSKRLGAAELLKKYFKGGQPPTLTSSPKVLEPFTPAPEKKKEETSSSLLKSNQIRRKIVNNFLDEKLMFNDCDRIKEEPTSKGIVLKEPREKERAETDKSFEDTLAYPKKMKGGESKKYVEATHKTYLASNDFEVRKDYEQSKELKEHIVSRLLKE
jgi:serine/threonine protein kinase